MLMRVLAPTQVRVRSGKSEREEGVTLTELLVVISIMVILMAIMASALGAFTHTSRVDAAADTLVSAFREARFYAMSKNVNVLPIILRDQKGKHTIVYGARALNFRGSLAAADAPPQSYTGATNPWTMYREELDGASLANGAFVYMVGTNTLDLNALTTDQAYFEMTYMKVTPPASAMERGDSSKWTYDIVGRGIHNTAYGTFNFTTTNYGGADGYVVVSGTGANYTFGTEAQMRDFTLSGFNLPDHVVVDQAPMLSAPAAYEERVAGILHAYAGRFYEDALLAPSMDPAEQHFPKEWYPLFLPIFQPDGRVKTSPNTSFLGGLEEDTGAISGIRNMVLRVVDTVTREQRYVVIGGSKDGQGGGSTGAIFVSMTLPKRYGKGGESAVPDYEDIYDPSTSSSNSTSTANSSNSSNSTNSNSTASTTSNSSTSSTGTASTSSNSTASSNTSNTSNTATSNTSNTSNNSNTNTSNTSATSNTGSTSSNSASTSSSTGTASTSASNSSTSNSSNNTTSNSSTANSSTSNTSSNSTSNTSTATTTGTPSSSGVSSSSGGTSSGDGTFP